MTAGLNVKVDIYQPTYGSDDRVGGANVALTKAYSSISARFSPRRPSQLMLEQGLEVDRVYDLLLQGHGVLLRERDEVQLVWPTDHAHYGHRYRVTGVQESSRRSRYGPIQATLSRVQQRSGGRP